MNVVAKMLLIVGVLLIIMEKMSFTASSIKHEGLSDAEMKPNRFFFSKLKM